MPYIIIIRGPLGVGKSTISKGLSKIFNAKYFTIDQILEENNLTTDKEAGYISQKSFITANNIIAPEIKMALNNGQSVVIDGNFYWESQINNLITRFDAKCYIFTLKATLEICIDRDSKRESPHGVGAATVVYKKTAEFDYGINIDTLNKTADDIIEEIVSNIN